MNQFDNVTIIKEANIYFEGNVTSRSVIFSDGARKTLGVMLPGSYQFNTEDKELMEILSGSLEVRLPDGEWENFSGGGSFEVPANSSFELKIHSITDYCCSFIK